LTVLELGAWKGRSTVTLSRVARYVVSVDHHRGIAEREGVDSLPDYLENVRSLSNVAIVIGFFDDVLPLLGEFFDMVYIDGSHDEESVFADTSGALDKVRRRGVIAFHDWDMKSVRAGAGRVLRVAPDNIVGSLAWFRLT
jgi:predicted O-methyltransferase YrrM